MPARIIAIVMLLMVVGFIALLASVTFFVREPLPIISSRSGMVVLTEPQAEALVAVVIDGGYGVELRLERLPVATESLRVALQPAAQGAQPIPLALEPVAEGSMIASGQLTQPGRWVVTLAAQGFQMQKSFIVQE